MRSRTNTGSEVQGVRRQRGPGRTPTVALEGIAGVVTSKANAGSEVQDEHWQLQSRVNTSAAGQSPAAAIIQSERRQR